MTDQLVHVAQAYCKACDLSLSRVSTLIFNDGKKLDAIATKGVDLSTSRFEHAMEWFSSNWPDGAEWPVKVERPRMKVARAS